MLCVFYLLQDRRVRLYDTTRNWALRKDVTTRMTRWTITGGVGVRVCVDGGGGCGHCERREMRSRELATFSSWPQ